MLPEKEMSSDKGFSPTSGKRALFNYFSPLSKLLVTFVNVSVCFTFLPFYNRQTADQIGAAGVGRQIKLWLAHSDTHTNTYIDTHTHHTLSGRCQMQQQSLLTMHQMGVTHCTGRYSKFNVTIFKEVKTFCLLYTHISIPAQYPLDLRDVQTCYFDHHLFLSCLDFLSTVDKRHFHSFQTPSILCVPFGKRLRLINRNQTICRLTGRASHFRKIRANSPVITVPMVCLEKE